MTTSPTVDLWFEFASTYSYPAVMRAEAVASERGVALRWRPFLLGPIFKAQGWNDSPFNLYPAKGDYMWRDLERTCTRLGVAYRRPSAFPRGGLLAARVACAHDEAPWLTDFIRAVYTANFARDEDTTSEAVIRRCIDGLGLPADEVLGAAQSDAGRAKLREQTAEATALGIFGAPTFMVGDEMFWGNDRMEEAMDWALAHPR